MNVRPILVAIADDHGVVRDSISNMLSTHENIEVVIKAANGRELIDRLDSSKVVPDVCILDIQMPEMNGYETMAYLRKHWPNIKVLILSMVDDEFAIIKMLKLGASGYMTKASDLEELQRAVVYLYQKGFYSSEVVASSCFKAVKSEKEEAISISERQMEFLRYCCSELSIKEIAAKMSISTSTALSYRNSLCEKLNLNTRQGLAMYAIKSGIVSFSDI